MVNVNRWAFGASIVCIGLWWFAGFSHVQVGVNPWSIALFGSLLTLVFGLLGLAGANSKFARIRSIFTLLITLVLSAFSMAVIFLGNVFWSVH